MVHFSPVTWSIIDEILFVTNHPTQRLGWGNPQGGCQRSLDNRRRNIDDPFDALAANQQQDTQHQEPLEGVEKDHRYLRKLLLEIGRGGFGCAVQKCSNYPP